MSQPVKNPARASIDLRAIQPHDESATDPSSQNETLLSPKRVSERFLERIPRDFARQHLILSQGSVSGVERLAVTESSDPAAIFNVGVRLGASIHSQVADGESIAQLIDEVYQHHAEADDQARDQSDDLTSGDGGDIDRPLANAVRDLQRLLPISLRMDLSRTSEPCPQHRRRIGRRTPPFVLSRTPGARH